MWAYPTLCLYRSWLVNEYRSTDSLMCSEKTVKCIYRTNILGIDAESPLWHRRTAQWIPAHVCTSDVLGKTAKYGLVQFPDTEFGVRSSTTRRLNQPPVALMTIASGRYSYLIPFYVSCFRKQQVQYSTTYRRSLLTWFQRLDSH